MLFSAIIIFAHAFCLLIFIIFFKIGILAGWLYLEMVNLFPWGITVLLLNLESPFFYYSTSSSPLVSIWL